MEGFGFRVQGLWLYLDLLESTQNHTLYPTKVEGMWAMMLGTADVQEYLCFLNSGETGTAQELHQPPTKQHELSRLASQCGTVVDISAPNHRSITLKRVCIYM